MISIVGAPGPRVSNASKEAAIEKAIATKVAECETTECKDTAAKRTKEVANLRAELASLKAQDTRSGNATSGASDSQSTAQANGIAGQIATPNGELSSTNEDQIGYGPFAKRASAAVQLALSSLEPESRFPVFSNSDEAVRVYLAIEP